MDGPQSKDLIAILRHLSGLYALRLHFRGRRRACSLLRRLGLCLFSLGLEVHFGQPSALVDFWRDAAGRARARKSESSNRAVGE